MHKIAVLIIFFLSSVSISVHGQSGDHQADLAHADSLFEAKKYTESFKIYESLFEDYHQVSAAMLLKMSFIKEGLGNYTDALYYLNLYYLQTADRKVLTKMEELAKARGLNGYANDDWEFIQTVFYKNFYSIIGVLLALAILLQVLVAYLKLKKKQSPVVPAIFMAIVLAVLFYTLNFGRQYDQSLITENDTYIMSGPSAGAEVVAIVKKGHRVKVKDKEDVWVQVEWKNQEAYIKADKLKAIQL